MKPVLIGCPIALGIGLLLAVGAAMFVGPFNPFLLAFLSTFEIRNDAGQSIRVTPIGMWEGNGRYGPLPMYRSARPPAIRLRPNCEIPLRPGETLSVTYDTDDINFRHILVHTDDGRVLVVDTDRKGTRSACYGPQQRLYVIPVLMSLTEASPELEPCLHGKSVRFSAAREYRRP